MAGLIDPALRLWRDPVPVGDAGLAACRSVYTDPLRVNGVPTALVELVDRARMLQRALDPLNHEVFEQFYAPGRCAFAFRLYGRHVGPLVTPLGDVAATGRVVEIRGIDIFELDDGRVAGVWAIADWLPCCPKPERSPSQAATHPQTEPVTSLLSSRLHSLPTNRDVRGNASRPRASPTMATSGATRRTPHHQPPQVDGLAIGTPGAAHHVGDVGQGYVRFEDLRHHHPRRRVKLGWGARQQGDSPPLSVSRACASPETV